MSKSACPSILNVKRPNTYTHINQHTDLNKCIINDTHMEELDSVQKFIEKQGWLLLTFFICLHNQLIPLILLSYRCLKNMIHQAVSKMNGCFFQ